MTTLSRPQAEALATFVRLLRPDWDHPGIVAAIRATEHGTPAEVGAALCRLAMNLQLRTPSTLAQPGRHWTAASLDGNPVGANAARRDMCPEHPESPRTECARHEAPSPPPEAYHAEIARLRAEGRIASHRHDRRPGITRPTTDLAAARARLGTTEEEEPA